MKRFSGCVRISAVLMPCCLMGVIARAALAQDAPTPTALPAPVAREKRVAALLSEAETQSKRDATGAIARVDEFVAEQPDLAPAEMAQLWGLKAEVQHQRLRDFDAALQTYREARARFAGETRPKSAWIGAGLLAGEARLLLARGDAQGAVALLEAQWPLIARSNSNRRNTAWSRTLDAVKTYVAALDATGRSADVPDALAARLLQAPAALDFAQHERDLGTLLLDLMRERLEATGRGAEVASWGRLRYALCDYSVNALDGATVFLARSWRQQPGRALTLVAAQNETEAPNPLDEVALPALLSSPDGRAILAEQSRALHELVRNGDEALLPDLIGVLLASGRYGAAMQWAQSAPATATGAAQVCRVFKAADLDTVRARAYLNWTQGEGQNPVPGFLAEHPADEPTPVGKPGAPPVANGAAQAEWSALMRADQGVTLGLVNEGLIAAREAEQMGALPLSETVRLLGEMNIHAMPKADLERVRLGLGEVLGRQLDALPPDQRPQLATSIRLAVADSYRSRGDRRAIPLFEAMIAEFEAQEQRKPGSFQKLWIVPLAHLAMFYSDQGEHLQAAQTWSRWSEIPSTPQWQADWRVAAAREYLAAGQPDRASALYAAVPQFGDGWQSSLALWDQANALIEAGQHQQARELLGQTVTGEGADRARVGLQALLALSYYRTGEIKAARAAAQASVDALAIDGKRAGKGTREQADSARELLGRLDEWEKQPIQLEPQQLRFGRAALGQMTALSGAKDSTIVRYVRVKTLTDEPLEAVSDNPAVQVQMLNEIAPDAFATVREVQVSIPLSALHQGLQTDITIRSVAEPKRMTVLKLLALQNED